MLVVHITILVITGLIILYTDHLGWRYLVGNMKVLDEKRMRLLHYAVGGGLIGMIATGLYMAWPALPTLWALPLFKLKMAFVVVLVINAFFMGMAIDVAAKTPFAELETKQKARLLISGALSTISWIGAVTVAIIFFG